MKSKIVFASFGTVCLISSSLLLGELSPAQANSCRSRTICIRGNCRTFVPPGCNNRQVPVPLLVPGVIALGAALARKRKAANPALNVSAQEG